MGIGYWIGHWADGKLGTRFCALIGLLVGVYAGFRNLMKAAAIMQREADREAEEELRKGPELLLRAEDERAAKEERAASAPPTAASKDEVSINAKGTGRGDAPS